jgi:hypothetical protein
MGPWILTKEAEEGGGDGSSFRGEHLPECGASLVQVVGAS